MTDHRQAAMTDREAVHFAAVGLGFVASGVLLYVAGRLLRTPRNSYRVNWGDA